MTCGKFDTFDNTYLWPKAENREHLNDVRRVCDVEVVITECGV